MTEREVWKFPLPDPGKSAMVAVPGGPAAQPVHVGHDPEGVPSIWLELNPAHPVSEIEVLLIGTGTRIDNRFAGGHAGSFMDGQFMGHVYRR